MSRRPTTICITGVVAWRCIACSFGWHSELRQGRLRLRRLRKLSRPRRAPAAGLSRAASRWPARNCARPRCARNTAASRCRGHCTLQRLDGRRVLAAQVMHPAERVENSGCVDFSQPARELRCARSRLAASADLWVSSSIARLFEATCRSRLALEPVLVQRHGVIDASQLLAAASPAAAPAAAPTAWPRCRAGRRPPPPPGDRAPIPPAPDHRRAPTRPASAQSPARPPRPIRRSA